VHYLCAFVIKVFLTILDGIMRTHYGTVLATPHQDPEEENYIYSAWGI